MCTKLIVTVLEKMRHLPPTLATICTEEGKVPTIKGIWRSEDGAKGTVEGCKVLRDALPFFNARCAWGWISREASASNQDSPHCVGSDGHIKESMSRLRKCQSSPESKLASVASCQLSLFFTTRAAVKTIGPSSRFGYCTVSGSGC